MIHIENLVDRISLQAQTFSHKLALEVAHSAHALLHTMIEHIEGLVAQAVDATRNQMVVALALVVETGDERLASVSLLVYEALPLRTGLLLHAYPERLLVVHVRSHSHAAIDIFDALKMADIFLEFLFTENRINSSQTEAFTPEIRRQGMKAVHRAWGSFHNDFERHRQIQLLQKTVHAGTLFVDDDHDF